MNGDDRLFTAAMAARIRVLEEQVAAFERRIAALEQQRHGGTTVSGWEQAARVLGLSAQTLKVRAKRDPKFPRPLRVNAHGLGRSRPEWSVTQLLCYKEGIAH